MAEQSVGTEYAFWLFDLDGTLVDTEWRYKRELFDRVGAELGRDFSDEFVTDLWHGLGGSRAAYLRDHGVEPGPFWEVFDRLDDPHARAEATYLYSDATWVGDLGVPSGVVTHCPAPIADTVMGSLDIQDWFDSVVHCNDDIGWKPDPGPVHRAMENLPLDATRGGILVGDGPADVGAAGNAGLDGAHVERHDPHRRGRCVLGEYRVRSLDELRSVVPNDRIDKTAKSA